MKKLNIDKEGLKEGVQTKITPLIIKESAKLKGSGMDLIENILRYIHNEYKLTKDLKIAMRTRDVDTLIESNILTSCNDYVHLFIALCRVKKIPAIYIETFHRDWLKSPKRIIKGHIFARIKLKDKEFIVDPTNGNVNLISSFGRYEPMCEGLDFGTLFPISEEYPEKIMKYFHIKF
jgi:hypothetical protein